MTLKGRFGVSRNTNKLVGVATDAFETDVLLGKLKALNSNDSAGKEKPIYLPELAKHFMVFIATTWHPKGKIQFLLGRWCLKTITAS